MLGLLENLGPSYLATDLNMLARLDMLTGVLEGEHDKLWGQDAALPALSVGMVSEARDRIKRDFGLCRF